MKYIYRRSTVLSSFLHTNKKNISFIHCSMFSFSPLYLVTFSPNSVQFIVWNLFYLIKRKCAMMVMMMMVMCNWFWMPPLLQGRHFRIIPIITFHKIYRAAFFLSPLFFFDPLRVCYNELLSSLSLSQTTVFCSLDRKERMGFINNSVKNEWWLMRWVMEPWHDAESMKNGIFRKSLRENFRCAPEKVWNGLLRWHLLHGGIYILIPTLLGKCIKNKA